MTADKRQPLGRGLNALFGDDEAAPYGATVANANTDATIQISRGVTRVPLSILTPGPFQPRKVFTEEAIDELAASLKQHGMVQPIVVRPKPDTAGMYEIIAGERRWRAAQRVPMHEVPVVIQDIDNKTAMEIALIENLQRADLNPLEEAQAFQRLIDEYNYKHDQLATVLGKSRSHITNMLRLLQLPKSVQDKMLTGELTMGHARALITADNPEEVMEQILKNNLSVRDTEKLVSKKTAKVTGTPQKIAAAVAKAGKMQKDADIRALENNLSQLLGLTVNIEPETNTKGKLTIDYHNLDQLDDVLRRLSR